MRPVYSMGKSASPLAAWLRGQEGCEWSVVDRLIGLGGSRMQEAPFHVIDGDRAIVAPWADRDGENLLRHGEAIEITVYTQGLKKGVFGVRACLTRHPAEGRR